MKFVSEITALQKFLQTLRKSEQKLGFVPTMGALHDGHLELVRAASRENDRVLVSIFVNPRQFNSTVDLAQYPRQIEIDMEILGREFPDVIVFSPSVDEMYPQNFNIPKYNLNGLDEFMEGAFRPGHFQGVAAIIDRFFSIVGACRAYFGEKDYQQLCIIMHVAKSLNHPVEVKSVPTLREIDGLAMSSRNIRLNPEQRKSAPRIYQGLKKFSKEVFYVGYDVARENFRKYVESDDTLELEYLILADSETLKPIVTPLKERGVRVFTSVFAGSVRLIDNIPL
ncbi:MAG: pantoate--beta-alanine ligase [Cryomorphaceae bacterium]|nr:pantoate--beta-alanine ligase [Cryomorphaceae bacterium]